MFQLFKENSILYKLNQSTFLNKLEYLLTSLIIFTLPYWGLYNHYFTFLIKALFILSLLSLKINLKEIFTNKVFLSLIIFILFTYISILWSASFPHTTGEYNMNVSRFKYYPLLIIAIYFSSFTFSQIKSLLFLMAISSSAIVVIYYLNYFGLTHIYGTMLPYSRAGTTNMLTNHLVNNFFILYSAIYFYISSLEYFMKKQYKITFLFIMSTAIFFVSLFIDPLTTSRLMVLVFLILFVLIPLMYIKTKRMLILLLLPIAVSILYISTSPKIKQGIHTFEIALNQDIFIKSWGHRLGYAIVGVKIFEEHILIGRGIADVTERINKFAEKHPKYFINDSGNRHFHNEHINILVQVGIIGYTLFIIFFFFFLKMKIDNSFVNKLKYSFFIAFFLLMFGEHYLTIRPVSTFFSLFIALLLLYNKREIELKTTLKEKI